MSLHLHIGKMQLSGCRGCSTLISPALLPFHQGQVTSRHVTSSRHVTAAGHNTSSRHVTSSRHPVIVSRHPVTSSRHVIPSRHVISHVITSRHHATSSRHVIRSRHGTQQRTMLVSSALNFPFLKEVSQNRCVFDVTKFKS